MGVSHVPPSSKSTTADPSSCPHKHTQGRTSLHSRHSFCFSPKGPIAPPAPPPSLRGRTWLLQCLALRNELCPPLLYTLPFPPFVVKCVRFSHGGATLNVLFFAGFQKGMCSFPCGYIRVSPTSSRTAARHRPSDYHSPLCYLDQRLTTQSFGSVSSGSLAAALVVVFL